jgi:hypothetical protein
MPNHEYSMLLFLELAAISNRKQQIVGQNKFLTLAGIEACMAGRLDVADGCRELVLCNNPSHMLRRWTSLPNAFRDESFQTFAKRLRLFCSPEKAEHLLTELGPDLLPSNAREQLDAGQMAMQRLEDMRPGPPP